MMMGITRATESEIWQQIERSESYLVCSMFEEAESLSSSIVKHLRSHEIQDSDMLESASMVLIQSLHHLHRTSQILDELKQSFSSIESIPVQILLTGACLQMSESSSGVGEILSDFLCKWRFVDGRYYVCDVDECSVVMEIDEYVEVVEFYVTKFLNDLDLATSWVEKAQLPDDTRQGIVRRLHSLQSAKATTLVSADNNNNNSHSSELKEVNIEEGGGKQLAVLRLSKRVEACFWWFRTTNLKFGNVRFVVSNVKVVLGCLMLILYWIIRRKRVSLKRIVERQALSLKKGMVELWRLAFSHEMNPLAAVQSPPTAFRGRSTNT